MPNFFEMPINFSVSFSDTINMSIRLRYFIITLISVFFICAPLASSAAIFDINLFYFSDAFTSSTTSSWGRTFYDFTAGISVDKRDMIQIGWDYVAQSATDATATTNSYTGTQMGPKIIFFLNKNFTWRVGLAYNLIASASYSNGTSYTWKGSGIGADFGYNLPLDSSNLLGVRFNYTSSSYAEQLIGTAYSTTTNSRVFIYPSISYSYVF